MATDKKITYEDQRLTKAQQKKIKPVVQAGTKNFLGKQEMVTVPKKWLSSSDHVVAELAYITPREQKILIDKNLYGSLKGKPNVGPGGIMSLQGGDAGGLGGDGPSGNDGDKEKGPSARDKQMGALGKTGKEDKSLSSGGSGVDRSKVSQFSTYGQNLMNQNLRSLQPSPFQKAINFYNKIPTPLNIAKKVLTKLGPLNNKDFYNEKVVPAGKTNLGYKDYMSARMAGKIDAYGNPTSNTGGGNNISDTGILQIKEINPVGNDQEVEVADTSNVNDMYFNFGTFSNPIYKKDLV